MLRSIRVVAEGKGGEKITALSSEFSKFLGKMKACIEMHVTKPLAWSFTNVEIDKSFTHR